MTTIVVGTDDSPGGRRAVRWALDEARIRGAELVVVHAWIMPLVDALPEPWVLATPVGHTDDRLHERLAQEAGALLDGVVAAAKEAEPGVTVRGELVEGRPAAALLEAARGADLLVVGSRGHGGFAGLVLGSVSSQCVHHGPCPVVVVPGEPAGN